MLETKNVSKSFLTKQVLKNVNSSLKPGSIYALLGPNGSGKTTWMKLAAALSKPSKGTITLDDQPISIKSREKIVFLPTENFFYNNMTIKDVGLYYDDFFADFSIEKYHDLINKMDLSEKSKIKTLSSGMLAKVKIAAAMSRNAPYYLLDEPLNGIDLIARDEVMQTIIESLNEDATIVISSHLVEELEPYVNQAIFFKQGEMIEQCDVEELRDTQGVSLADHYRTLMKGDSINA